MSLYLALYDKALGVVFIKPRQEFYSVKQVETILNVKRMTIHRAIESGALKAIAEGGVHKVGRWRIPYNALVEYIRTRWHR